MTWVWPDPLECQKLKHLRVSSLKTLCYLAPQFLHTGVHICSLFSNGLLKGLFVCAQRFLCDKNFINSSCRPMKKIQVVLSRNFRHVLNIIYLINFCVNMFFEHGTYILLLLVHKYSKFLIFVLTMYMSLHSKFFKNFGIKVKTLYKSKIDCGA